MRPIERIPIFLDLINGRNVEIFNKVWELNGYVDFDMFADLYDAMLIKEFWLENPDLRYSQVLVGLRIIPNVPGFWYYKEENEILEKLGIDPREYLLWGQNYDKDMNLLPKIIYKPIKELSTEHIKAILDGGFAKREKYIKCFKKELELRSNEQN